MFRNDQSATWNESNKRTLAEGHVILLFMPLFCRFKCKRAANVNTLRSVVCERRRYLMIHSFFFHFFFFLHILFHLFFLLQLPDCHSMFVNQAAQIASKYDSSKMWTYILGFPSFCDNALQVRSQRPTNRSHLNLDRMDSFSLDLCGLES